jgi:hypothetical protein
MVSAPTSMTYFIIDGFDFGVDTARSFLTVTNSTFELQLVGNDAIIEKLTGREDHPWNWLIQPPFLYAIGVPCQLDTNGDFEHDITEQELDDYDIALYVMEHCDVLPCKVTKTGGIARVSGKVHNLFTPPVNFHARFEI